MQIFKCGYHFPIQYSSVFLCFSFLLHHIMHWLKETFTYFIHVHDRGCCQASACRAVPSDRSVRSSWHGRVALNLSAYKYKLVIARLRFESSVTKMNGRIGRSTPALQEHLPHSTQTKPKFYVIIDCDSFNNFFQ